MVVIPQDIADVERAADEVEAIARTKTGLPLAEYSELLDLAHRLRLMAKRMAGR